MIKNYNDLQPGDFFQGQQIIAVERTSDKYILLTFENGKKQLFCPNTTFWVEETRIIDIPPFRSREK